MPHYADGTPAQVGDVVYGSGYNDTKLAPVVGRVTDVRPGETCTLTIVYISEEQIPEKLEPWQVDKYRSALLLGSGQNVRAYSIKTEYGDTKGFNKVPPIQVAQSA